MFLKRFFEPKLAQTSYMIGCAAAREAIVIDANRNIEQYIQAAQAEGARIAHVTETHIHADYVSGSRELAARTGATLYLSDEGGPDWTYGFEGVERVVRVKHGHRIRVGNVLVDVVHTPGHTPEHISFLVTDSAVADEPIGVATGDFIFVGDVGRPDLLERAANMAGTMEVGARTLFTSLQQFSTHPDWLQIWPGHGAGSACGKGISAVPQSTLGYERRFNWAFQAKSNAEFVESVLAGQPEPPAYFKEMKRINKVGPPLIGQRPAPPQQDLDAFEAAIAARAVVVDLRPAAAFAVGHVPGTINIPLNGSFLTWAGWLLPYSQDLLLILDSASGQSITDAMCDLSLIGLDNVTGWFDASVVDGWAAGGRALQVIPQITAQDLRESLSHGAVTLIDVRNQSEWDAGHIAGAQHIGLGYLTARLQEIPRTRPIVVQCAAGARSSIGASLLQAHGVDRVINLIGGIGEWRNAGLPTSRPAAG